MSFLSGSESSDEISLVKSAHVDHGAADHSLQIGATFYRDTHSLGAGSAAAYIHATAVPAAAGDANVAFLSTSAANTCAGADIIAGHAAAHFHPLAYPDAMAITDPDLAFNGRSTHPAGHGRPLATSDARFAVSR